MSKKNFKQNYQEFISNSSKELNFLEKITKDDHFWFLLDTHEEYIQGCKDIWELLDRLKEELPYSEIYGYFSKLLNEDHEEEIESIMDQGERFSTYSDRGGVMIGYKDMQLLIRNGFGDGITSISIVDKNTMINEYMFNDLDIFIQGTINIYDYDCGPFTDEHIVKTLQGTYLVYAYQGEVLFKEV